MTENKFREQAIDKDKYDGMVKMFSNAGTPNELESAAMLYIMDMNYHRSDISLAVKEVELAKGWR